MKAVEFRTFLDAGVAPLILIFDRPFDSESDDAIVRVRSSELVNKLVRHLPDEILLALAADLNQRIANANKPLPEYIPAVAMQCTVPDCTRTLRCPKHGEL